MDVGDLSGTAGLVGSGSISVATGVGIIANTTSATPGWWTPTSTIASAAANTDVVSLLLLLHLLSFAFETFVSFVTVVISRGDLPLLYSEIPDTDRI